MENQYSRTIVDRLIDRIAELTELIVNFDEILYTRKFF